MTVNERRRSYLPHVGYQPDALGGGIRFSIFVLGYVNCIKSWRTKCTIFGHLLAKPQRNALRNPLMRSLQSAEDPLHSQSNLDTESVCLLPWQERTRRRYCCPCSGSRSESQSNWARPSRSPGIPRGSEPWPCPAPSCRLKESGTGAGPRRSNQTPSCPGCVKKVYIILEGMSSCWIRICWFFHEEVNFIECERTVQDTQNWYLSVFISMGRKVVSARNRKYWTALFFSLKF